MRPSTIRRTGRSARQSPVCFRAGKGSTSPFQKHQNRQQQILQALFYGLLKSVMYVDQPTVAVKALLHAEIVTDRNGNAVGGQPAQFRSGSVAGLRRLKPLRGKRSPSPCQLCRRVLGVPDEIVEPLGVYLRDELSVRRPNRVGQFCAKTALEEVVVLAFYGEVQGIGPGLGIAIEVQPLVLERDERRENEPFALQGVSSLQVAGIEYCCPE